MKDLKGKTAFITGGASGLGLGIAKSLSAEGVNVILVDLRKNVLDEAVKYFEDKNLPVYGIWLDVTDRAAFEKAAVEAENAFGKLHILVNNAGIGCAAGPLWLASYKDTDFAISQNLTNILNGIQIILPLILKHGEGGHVVNTSSKNGILPAPGLGLYNMTKQAVVGLTETLAADLVGTGIGASVFCPGPHASDLGNSSREVQAIILSEEIAPPRAPRVPKDDEEAAAFAQMGELTRSAEQAGDRVVRGIKRDDLYILTHSEFKKAFDSRVSAMLRSFPDEVPDERFVKAFSFLLSNPMFDKQTQVPAL
jgi:NAD(P)-dependent dehydrogenase (short-subunit alcohol dehydrogenase family)